jgi:hypothetical protein
LDLFRFWEETFQALQFTIKELIPGSEAFRVMETVMENRVSTSSPPEESVKPLMRTDSMSSDSSIDSENLVDIPVSPSMMVSKYSAFKYLIWNVLVWRLLSLVRDFFKDCSWFLLSLICQPYPQSVSDMTLHRGDVTPDRGDMTPYQGSMTPYRGDMTPDRGDMTPDRGDMTPYQGSMTPDRGDMTPYQGSMTPDRVGNTPDQEFEKEVEKQEKKRHKNKWKGDAQRVANKLSSVLKKRGRRHGGSESASFSTRLMSRHLRISCHLVAFTSRENFS